MHQGVNELAQKRIEMRIGFRSLKATKIWTGIVRFEQKLLK